MLEKIYTKIDLIAMTPEEREQHKDDAWDYFTKVKRVKSFMEIED